MNNIDWSYIEKEFPVGKEITAKVLAKLPFGFFLDIGHSLVGGLLEIIELENNNIELGENILVVVMDYTYINNQVRFTQKKTTIEIIRNTKS